MGVMLCGAVLIVSTLIAYLVASDVSEEPYMRQAGLEQKIEDTYSKGDPRICLKENKNLRRLEVLPGWGWDNLRNVDGNNVMVYNYSRCRTTLDGRFLIPDDVETIPRKSSMVNSFSELISHYTGYTSATARSINVHAGFSGFGISVSGSFSDSYQHVKSKQIGDKTVTTRVQLRYARYTANLRSKFNLHPDFKARLFDIAKNLRANRSDEVRYQCQLLVRDFGTHFLKSVDAGAVLAQEDQISASFVNTGDSTKKEITVAASGSFFGLFSFGASYKTSSSESATTKYQNQRTSSEILSYGGPKFKALNFTVNDWAELVDQNMVAIDRRGEPLQYLVTKANLPELSLLQVRRLHAAVKEAILLYYKYNTYRGCTKIQDKNYSPLANVDDGTCSRTFRPKSFGGTFQKCDLDHRSNNGDLCSKNKMNQVNPRTGGYSCPAGHHTVKLHTGILETAKPRPDCYMCQPFFLCCNYGRIIRFRYSRATYSTYWCAGNEAIDRSGYLFGGLFTSNLNNPVTHAKKCPPNFYTRLLGTVLKICISDDYDVAKAYAVPFGGLISCMSGNPFTLTSNVSSGKSKSHALRSFIQNSGIWPRRCPNGFSQHLAYVDQGCEIHYCLRSESMPKNQNARIRRPPFLDPPANVESTRYVVLDPATNKWKPFEDMQILQKAATNRETPAEPSTSDDYISNGTSMSNWSIVGITVGAFLVGSILTILGIVGMNIRLRRRKGQEYTPLTSTSDHVNT